MRKTALYATVLSLTLYSAAGALAEIYKYRTPDGKLHFSNRPPSVVADVERRESNPTPNTQVIPQPTSKRPRSAPEPQRSYVDLHPLQIGSPRVLDTEVWWKKIVTGVVENRSGRTRTENVLVEINCGSHEGNDYLGDIAPRGRKRYRMTVILYGDRPPARVSRHTPALRCSAGAKWINIF